MSEKEINDNTNLIVWLLLLILLFTISYICANKASLSNKYETSITSGEVFQIGDAKYKCNKVEVQETVWKKVNK